jgi:hypothetical protein
MLELWVTLMTVCFFDGREGRGGGEYGPLEKRTRHLYALLQILYFNEEGLS